MKTETIKTITIFILVCGILIVIGIYNLIQYHDKVYLEGFQDGMFFVNNQILDDLKTNGFITFSWVENNQTQRINLAPVQS